MIEVAVVELPPLQQMGDLDGDDRAGVLSQTTLKKPASATVLTGPLWRAGKPGASKRLATDD
jgi:hypothetical protein